MLTIKPKTRKEIYLAYLSGDMSLELPEPLTRDEVNLYNLCKNKAYGEYTTVKEVLAEQKAENLEYMDGLGYLVPQSIGLVVGGKYIVTYNGVDYECTCIDGSVANATGNVFLGDISLVTPGQEEIYDEPFMLVDMPEDGVTGIVPTAAQVAFESISIRQEVTEVKKISGKYVEGMGWSEKQENAVLADSVSVSNDAFVVGAFDLVLGEIYTVVFDGTRYENLVCFNDGAYPTIGSPLGDFADYPFNLSCVRGSAYFACSDSEQHTLTVIGCKETVHPLDRRYAPTTKFYLNTDDGKVYKNPQFTESVTQTDVVNAFDSGIIIERAG